jgi:hypothetical protein
LRRSQDSQKVQEDFTWISIRFISMSLAGVPWGTRRAIHLRGKMWMARQFDLKTLIAAAAISSDFAANQIEAVHRELITPTALVAFLAG